jgi:hypothetical protein
VAIAVLAAAISLGLLVMASRPMQERTLCRFTTPSIDRSDRASEIEDAADQLAAARNSALNQSGLATKVEVTSRNHSSHCRPLPERSNEFQKLAGSLSLLQVIENRSSGE